jgi:hypothetical protein
MNRAEKVWSFPFYYLGFAWGVIRRAWRLAGAALSVGFDAGNGNQ